MSLYKRPLSQFWWFQIWTTEGKRIRKSTGTDDKAKAAIIEQTFAMAYGKKTPAAKLHAMLDAVCGSGRQSVALSELWPTHVKWIELSGKSILKHTLENRKYSIARFARWAEVNWPAAKTADSVDRAVAAAFAAFLADSGIMSNTRRHVIADLSTVWEVLKRGDDDLKNPWPAVMPEVTDSERGKPFTREQDAAILEAAEKVGGGWSLACQIARHTGLRYSSVARLKWREIDFEKGVIRHMPPKTARHNIEVVLPLTRHLRDVLEKASAERQAPMLPGRQKRKSRAQDPANVLPLHAAYYPDPEYSGGPGAFAEVLKAAGLEGKGYTFHSWRHTFRTRLSEAGVSDDLAKRLGGWTEDATAARYDHAERLEELRAAVEKAK
jgi:integrase